MGYKVRLRGTRVIEDDDGSKVLCDRVEVVDGDHIVSETNVLPHPCPPGAYREYKLMPHYYFASLQDAELAHLMRSDVAPVKLEGEERLAEKDRQVQKLRALSALQSPSYDDAMDVISKDPHTKDPTLLLSPREVDYCPKTVDELLAEFREVQTVWKESPYYETFVSRITKLKRTTCVPFTKVVALGTGSIHRSHVASETRSAEKRSKAYAGVSVKQLAAAMAMQELLGDPEQPLPCTVHDPIYSEVEKQALAALGFKVVEFPDDMQQITSGSIVMYLATQLSMAWDIGQGIWPAAMICNAWDAPDASTPEDLPRAYFDFVRFLFGHYEQKPFQSVGHEKSEVADGLVFLYQLRHKLS